MMELEQLRDRNLAGMTIVEIYPDFRPHWVGTIDRCGLDDGSLTIDWHYRRERSTRRTTTFLSSHWCFDVTADILFLMRTGNTAPSSTEEIPQRAAKLYMLFKRTD